MDYSQYKHLDIAIREDGITVLTVNRPEVLNAVNAELHSELEYIWVDQQRDENVKIVIITGAGAAFMAGGDIKRMSTRAGTDEGVKFSLDVIAMGRRLCMNMLELQKPLIAAVNGDAIGLGATIALLTDRIVMSETAKIGDPHVRIGLVAGDGGAGIWPLLIGPSRAKEFLMWGTLMTGKEAAEMGLISRAVAPSDVLSTAMGWAEQLNKLPTYAVRLTKAAINSGIRQHFSSIMDVSIGFEALSMHSHDFREGATAFAEKRKPVFKGR